MQPMRYINLILIVLLCSSCTGIFTMAGIDVQAIDYGKLFEVSMDLLSTDKSKNTEALEYSIGKQNTEKVLSWYEGTLLAIKAGKAIIDGVKSRDLRVNTIINNYNQSMGVGRMGKT